MFNRQPRRRIETGEIPTVGRSGKGPASDGSALEKGRTTDRNLTIFKSLVLAALVTITLYGTLNQGLLGVERWLPVDISILGLLFIALLIADYFADVKRAAWMLVGLLAVLVAVKGLSLTWSISRTETVKELLRSSMYLATFTLAAASLSSRRFVGPLIDGLNLVAGAVAGYGVLQKVNPVGYPSSASDGVRVDTTLGYANTTAVVLGMGIVLGLSRMTGLKNPVVRGLYAALILVFGAILYLTFSRGGMLALAVGLAVLFVVGKSRLQMFANLLLVSGPLVWLAWKVQSLRTFFGYEPSESLRSADGATFRTELLIAVLVAFVLQVVYTVLAGRYELSPALHRGLGVAAVIVVLVGAGVLGLTVLESQGGSNAVLQAFTSKVENTQDVRGRLTSLSSNSRTNYWRVAWDEWKAYPLTGTGAGTFMYTWLENRPGFGGVKQVHNVYLEQGTETGIVAFLALAGFAILLVGYTVRAAWRAAGERKLLLAGLTGAVIVYLVSSAFEWHWYIPPSTIYFFILAGVTVKLASGTEQPAMDEASGSQD